jgi:hypothetical protein
MPGKPKLSWAGQGEDQSLILRLPSGPQPWLWVVQQEQDGDWTTRIVPGHTQKLDDLTLGGDKPAKFVVSAVNRVGIAGPAATIESE